MKWIDGLTILKMISMTAFKFKVRKEKTLKTFQYLLFEGSEFMIFTFLRAAAAALYYSCSNCSTVHYYSIGKMADVSDSAELLVPDVVIISNMSGAAAFLGFLYTTLSVGTVT